MALPDWILTAVALLAILGFPVALVLAWAYDFSHVDAPAAAFGMPCSSWEARLS